MNELTDLVQFVSDNFPHIAVYWLALEKLLKLAQPILLGAANRAIARVAATAETDDDDLMMSALRSKPWRILGFALDLLVRVKLPTAADLEAAIKQKTKTKE